MPELPTPFGPPLGNADAVLLASTIKALADPIRLQLLNILWRAPDNEATVADLVDTLDRVQQPTVSHHLRILADAGLVTRVKDGVWVTNRLAVTGAAAITSAIRGGAW